MNNLRALVVGCGRIGSRFSEDARLPGVYSHAEAFQLDPRTELVGLVDSDEEERDRAGRKWNCIANGDLASALESSNPELVSICTPDATHLEIVKQVVSHPSVRALIMEKPLAEDLVSAERIVDLVQSSGKELFLNYSRRFSPAYQHLRDGVREQRWGKPVLSRFLYGKGLLHNGSHALDLLRFLFGELKELSWLSEVVEDHGEAAGDVQVTMKGPGRAVLQHVPESVATLFEGDLIFERARWQFELGGSQWRFFEPQSAMFAGYTNFVPADSLPDEFEDPLGPCLPGLVDNVIQSLAGEAEPLCSGSDGLTLMRAMQSLTK